MPEKRKTEQQWSEPNVSDKGNIDCLAKKVDVASYHYQFQMIFVALLVSL